MKRVGRWTKIALAPAVLAVVFLLLAACGGGSEQPPTATEGPTGSPAASESPSASAAPATVSPLPTECIASPGEAGVRLISDLSLDEDRREFSFGEPITMTLLLLNCGADDKHLFYANSQRYDFIVEDEQDAEVWRWSADRAFAEVLGEMTIRSGERVTYSEAWDQRDSAGQQVPAGRYKVSGYSVGCGVPAATGCFFGPSILFEITP